MQIQFYKVSTEFLKEKTVFSKLLKSNSNEHWCIVLGAKELRFKKDDTIKSSNKVHMDKYYYTMFNKQCTEYFPKIKNSSVCRVCSDNLTGDFHDDGLCSKCWDKIMNTYYHYDKYEVFGNLFKPNKQAKKLLTKEHLLHVINEECIKHSPNFKIRRTAGLKRLGTFHYNRGYIKSVNYSHLVPPKQQISTLLHEFTHAYSYINLTENESTDEVLTQKVEAYLYNYFLYSDNSANAYSYSYFLPFKNDLDNLVDYRSDLAKDIANNIVNIIESYYS